MYLKHWSINQLFMTKEYILYITTWHKLYGIVYGKAIYTVKIKWFAKFVDNVCITYYFITIFIITNFPEFQWTLKRNSLQHTLSLNLIKKKQNKLSTHSPSNYGQNVENMRFTFHEKTKQYKNYNMLQMSSAAIFVLSTLISPLQSEVK